MLDLVEVYLARGMQEKAYVALEEIEARRKKGEEINSEQQSRLIQLRRFVYGNGEVAD
jgi:hypothetical protein